jgi:hypothetical protein
MPPGGCLPDANTRVEAPLSLSRAALAAFEILSVIRGRIRIWRQKGADPEILWADVFSAAAACKAVAISHREQAGAAGRFICPRP